MNIGVNGRISDGGVFFQSELWKALSQGTLNVPHPVALPGQTDKTPYVLLADDAFPLSDAVMKPYPTRNISDDCKIFNYRLSRARRTIESAFGILANRFRVLLTPINLAAEKVQHITLACVVLHNVLLKSCPTGNDTDINQLGTQQMPPVDRQSGNRNSTSARQIRERFKLFFSSELGAVTWQNDSIRNFNY